MFLSGCNMVWLHGWGFTKQVFSFLDEENKSTSTKAPCLYQLSRRAGTTGWPALLQTLITEIEEETVLVGWSMGGQLALQLATLTNRIKKLVLIASAPKMVNGLNWQNTISASAFSALQNEMESSPEKAVQQIIALTAHGEPNHKQSRNYLGNYVTDNACYDILKEWLKEMATCDLRGELASLNIPVLFILGENDALVKPAVIEQLNHAHVQYQVIPSCGHAPFINHPEKMLTVINEFVAT